MNKQLRNIVLLPNTSKPIDPSLVRKLISRMRSLGVSLRADAVCKEHLPTDADCTFYTEDASMFDGADAVLVLGGDGSIIEAARRSLGYGVPIAAVNCGRLGYLAEIEIEELALIDQVIRGAYTVEERIMMDVEIIREDASVRFQTPALNDVVLSNGPITRLLSFELWCNGEQVENCFADGMILSTPTGSTAYSRSAGGPILDPVLDCICVTPICPQTMTSYPVIFGGDSVLELKNMTSRGNDVYVSVDGRDYVTLQDGDVVRIKRSLLKTSLIRVKNGGFLRALRRKLT